MSLEQGTVVAGKYRIERLVGAGGMGTVYEGRHLEVGYAVAVKVLKEDHLADAETVARFHAEARAVARLKSKHVAKVFDVGQLPDGRPFMVLEFLDGTDLESELQRRTRLPHAEACRHVISACHAMVEAHAAGIIHRDLKPANLFLAKEGADVVLKVVDFGISRVASEDGVRLTQTQSAFGTPLYMAPESVRSAKLADERTDVWALGVILYELVTGAVPFLGDTPTAVAVAVTIDELRPPSALVPDLPPFIDALVTRALEKNPAKRFQTALEFAQAIEAGLAEAAAPPSATISPAPAAWDRSNESALIPVSTLPREPRASRVALGAAIVLALAAGVGLAAVVMLGGADRHDVPSPGARTVDTSAATPETVVPSTSEPAPTVTPADVATPMSATPAPHTSGQVATASASTPTTAPAPEPVKTAGEPPKPSGTPVAQPPPVATQKPTATGAPTSIKGSPTRL